MLKAINFFLALSYCVSFAVGVVAIVVVVVIVIVVAALQLLVVVSQCMSCHF
jgi:hypothetical protein